MIKFISKIVLLFSIWLFASFYACAIDNYYSGSRFAAMANCGVSIPDIWSVSRNQAGIAFINKSAISFYYEQRFAVKELSLSSLAVAIPVRFGCFGTQLNYFGYSKYHELKAGLSYGKLLGKKIAAGIQLNYFSSFIPISEKQLQYINFELGIMYAPYENFTVGFHVFNPIPEKQYSLNTENIPTQACLGMSYNIRKIVTIATETEAGYDNEAIYRLGIEYIPVQLFALRLGISSGTTNYSFGFGYNSKRFQTNIAFSNNTFLGFTPHFDVLINF
jgi:hypothetical protein